MVLDRDTVSLKVILSLLAYDEDNELIERIVYFDTNTLLGKRLVGDETTNTQVVIAANFAFHAPDFDTYMTLLEELPLELHHKIIRDFGTKRS